MIIVFAGNCSAGPALQLVDHSAMAENGEIE
jgi:hypothetical protein